MINRKEDHKDKENEQNWFEQELASCEASFLASDNPRKQSGFNRDEADWQRYRRPITKAIHKDGTLLDIGCANGLLMETISQWTKEDGYSIEPFGLDISNKLAQLARTRLPDWQQHIYVGNALYWQPPQQYDFVRTELVYVPTNRRKDYINRLLNEFVAPGGRLILCSYGSSRPEGIRGEDLVIELNQWNFTVSGVYELKSSEYQFVITQVVWLEKV